MDNKESLKSLAISFDLKSGLSTDAASTRRYLSAMQGTFADTAAYREELDKHDALVYEFYELGIPPKAGEVAFGTSIVYPGMVGDEYFMTKGHFHTILDTGEVYYCLRGRGFMLMENPEGDWEARRLSPGAAVYVPPRFAHRSINVAADEPLVTFFAFPADAGHDYGTIETKGFRKLVVDRDGAATVIDNPAWGGGEDGPDSA
jgi:glucose-6-phosphate isomerase